MNHLVALSGRLGVILFKSAVPFYLMNSNLLVAASKVIPLTELLVNVVSRRVRQLNQGHRPLVAAPPGMGIADIALT